MPKKAKELTALKVASLKMPGRYAVGGADGLHLRIAGGSRAWVLRLKIGGPDGARSDMGLGPFPEVSLSEAREKAREHRKRVRDGANPLQEKREARVASLVERAKTKSFRECAEAYIESHRAGWKNAKHAAQWTATLETYAYPFMGDNGDLAISAVDTAHVMNVLEPIWKTKTETASRVRGRIEQVIDWATVAGYRTGENPARWAGHLKHALPSRSKAQKVEHYASLPYLQVGIFMVALRARDGVTPRALEFAILTAARSGEVRGATWAEVDMKARTWTVPAARMKAGKEHVVPLSDAAVALLEALPTIEGSEHVFAAPRGGVLSDMSLTAVLKRMGHTGLTQHGFRSTFREWAANETNHSREVIEHALAHQLKDKAEAAYQRGTMLPPRIRLMADWSSYCGTVQSAADNVVAIRREAA